VKFITRYWYQPALKPPAYLRILSRLFRVITEKRRQSFLRGSDCQYRSPVPVIVVGNISIGGTGKTPLLIALCHYLQSQGLKVGIISRGYGGKAKQWPVEVTQDSLASLVGDEPLLIHRQTQCVMFVGADRNADINALLKKYSDVNVILSDDGLQHYAMQRDIEIAVIDGQRLFGNCRLLPAGPLREPVSRLQETDIQVLNGGDIEDYGNSAFFMQFEPTSVYRLTNKSQSMSMREFCQQFSGRQLRAIAGIGNPQRFFDMLISHGLDIVAHAFEDHFPYQKNDLLFQQSLPLIMTEKDAVKCAKFGIDDCWVVAVSAQLDDDFYAEIARLLELRKH